MASFGSQSTAFFSDPSRCTKRAAEFVVDECAHASEGEVAICCCNVANASNIGSMFRLCANFGVREMLHLYPNASGHTAPTYEGAGRIPARDRASVQSTARGTQRHTRRIVSRIDVWLEEFFADAAESANFVCDGSVAEVAARQVKARPPLVVVETAAGAVSLHEFRFPSRCILMVGAEDAGVDAQVLERLVPGYDSIVFIPMPGKHKSMNVAAAAAVALYEFRRQWPDVSASMAEAFEVATEQDENQDSQPLVKLDVKSRGVSWSADLALGRDPSNSKTYAYYLAEGTGSTDAFGELRDAVFVLPSSDINTLAFEPMKAAAAELVGRHNFGAFATVPAGDTDTVRHVSNAEVALANHACFETYRLCFVSGHGVMQSAKCPYCSCSEAEGNVAGVAVCDALGNGSGLRLVVIRVTIFGGEFLKHMMRRIAGFLIQVGLRGAPPSQAKDLLAAGAAGMPWDTRGDVNCLPGHFDGTRIEKYAGSADFFWKPMKAPAKALWLESCSLQSTQTQK